MRGIDPKTNDHYDDTRRYIDQVTALIAENCTTIFEGNARKVASTTILTIETGSKGNRNLSACRINRMHRCP